jgi:hypothetical protein
MGDARKPSQPAAAIAMHDGMTATDHPDEPLVVGLSVLYEDEPDGRVIAHIPRCWGPSAAAMIVTRRVARGAGCCAT